MFQVQVWWFDQKWFDVGAPYSSEEGAQIAMGAWAERMRVDRWSMPRGFRVVKVNGEDGKKTEERSRLQRAADTFLGKIRAMGEMAEILAEESKTREETERTWRYAAKVCAAMADITRYGFRERAIEDWRNDELPKVALEVVFGALLMSEYVKESEIPF